MKREEIDKLFQGEKIPKSERQQFQNEIAEININRMRTVASYMLLLFSLLLLLDYSNFKNGLWLPESAYGLLFAAHCSALFFLSLFKFFLFYRKRIERNLSSSQIKIILMLTANLFLMHISVISYCDVINTGSAAAYIGAIFALAAFFIISPGYGIIVFTYNLFFMVGLIMLASKQSETLLSVQIINISIYSIFAFILSGMLFRYQQKDFINRRKIQLQTQKLEKLAMEDPLTGIMNRRHFLSVIGKELARSQRHGHALSLTIFDIDSFKNINDKYGHNIGDKVLVSLCLLIQSNIRNNDIFARWGGEEFILISLDTPKDAMFNVCEKLRNTIEAYSEKGLPSITASFGISGYDVGDSIEDMIHRADVALYEAKDNGRNCIR